MPINFALFIITKMSIFKKVVALKIPIILVHDDQTSFFCLKLFISVFLHMQNCYYFWPDLLSVKQFIEIVIGYFQAWLIQHRPNTHKSNLIMN